MTTLIATPDQPARPSRNPATAGPTETAPGAAVDTAGAVDYAHARPDAMAPSKPVRSVWTAVRSAVSAAGELPDIVKEPRPPLREVWLYAVAGQWTGRAGEWTPARVAAAVYAALVAIPLIAVGYLLLWVVERPARAAVAASIYMFLKLAL